MSHPSYAKGYRYERARRQWYQLFGDCVRTPMSRKPDLTFTFSFRRWAVECKKRKSKFGWFYKEFEHADIIDCADDGQIPFLCILKPKAEELFGKAAVAEAMGSNIEITEAGLAALNSNEAA
jgi:hypothetical protein